MDKYEAPAIIELGSIADFTRGDTPAWRWDGIFAENIL
ncbi:MAG: lasso RiPP family leader peptide-containing protein, partial [Ilumatobacteraceae bacterium]